MIEREEIQKLIKSNNRDDVKLGILLAIKENGIEWCKKEFKEGLALYWDNSIYGAISIRFKNGEYIYHNLFTEYISTTHKNYDYYITEHCEDIYEYEE